MKSKMITSLILILFSVTILSCFPHIATMMSPANVNGQVVNAIQSVCQITILQWRDLSIALPMHSRALGAFILTIIAFFVFLGRKQIKEYLQFLQSVRLYSKTYPNFSSLNFLSYAFQRGILHPKLF